VAGSASKSRAPLAQNRHASSEIHELTPESLDQLAIADVPDTVKVVNLVKLLRDLVANERDTKPFLISNRREGGEDRRLSSPGWDISKATSPTSSALARSTNSVRGSRKRAVRRATGWNPLASRELLVVGESLVRLRNGRCRPPADWLTTDPI
jgi:hypothetical protein